MRRTGTLAALTLALCASPASGQAAAQAADCYHVIVTESTGTLGQISTGDICSPIDLPGEPGCNTGGVRPYLDVKYCIPG